MPAIFGVDLGTTNTVVAYAKAGESPRLLGVEQLVAAGELGVEPRIASVLYAPTPGEVEPGEHYDPPWLVGAHARRRASEVAGRGVSSAKSWLSYAAVDRTAPLLPVAAAEGVAKVSPVDAAELVLRRARATCEAHAEASESATTVLTVPASFDPTARHLTLAAARRAGLAVRLLEEPLAAFYCYQSQVDDRELVTLLGDEAAGSVLVVDVGGGTTDLTLVELRRAAVGMTLHRTAVGEHLLLGGDNVDIALTHLAEKRLGSVRLEPSDFGQLLASCRDVKERLLAPGAPEHGSATLSSRGAQLVGGTRTVRIERFEVEALLLDGFLPRVELGAVPAARRAGLQAFGLPYATDPAITRHVAAFLHRHATSNAPVVALLLNGGLFNCPLAAERLHQCVKDWGFAGARLLPTQPNDAVALGAAAYGAALAGHGRRASAGASAGYYLQVRQGAHGERTAVCVVPRGSLEAERHSAGGKVFELTTGKVVRFDLYSNDEQHHPPGQEVAIGPSFTRLTPLATRVGAEESSLRVVVEGELTAVGSLDLALVDAAHPERRFELAFDVAVPVDEQPDDGTNLPQARARANLAEALELVRDVFGKPKEGVDARASKALLRELERLLGARENWPMDVLRAIGDELLTKAKAKSRKRSEEHERVFWLLAGYALRPGFGYVGDDQRVARLVPLMEQGLVYQDAVRGWQQYWIAWRRVCGGLPEAEQNRLRDWIDPSLSPADARLKRRKGFRPGAQEEMWDLAVFLERADVERRVALGEWLVERTWTDRDPKLWRRIGQVGARVPTYASVHHVLSPRVVERWIGHLMRERWQEVPTAAAAAVRLARMTGDRQRDVADSVRRDIAARLEKVGADEGLRRQVQEIVPVDVEEIRHQFGDELPIGLAVVAGTEP